MQEIKMPGFSAAERDRRYRAVRQAMAERGLDCVIAPQNTGEWGACQPDARYLTSIGGGGTAVAAVLASEGAPIAIIRDSRRTEFWNRAQDWVTEVRGTVDGRWGEALVQAVRDLGCESRRIGLSGLAGVLRNPDGTVSHGEYAALRDAFPQATFLNATDLMHDIRMIKSAEEIAMIERAQRCADAISEAAFEIARPGTTEHELQAEMMAAHIRSGGEVPAMLLMGIGKAPDQTYLVPTMRSLEPNDILICESEIKFGGYMAQSIEALSLGPPSADYQRLYDSSLECFYVLLDVAKPGVPLCRADPSVGRTHAIVGPSRGTDHGARARTGSGRAKHTGGRRRTGSRDRRGPLFHPEAVGDLGQRQALDPGRKLNRHRGQRRPTAGSLEDGVSSPRLSDWRRDDCDSPAAVCGRFTNEFDTANQGEKEVTSRRRQFG